MSTATLDTLDEARQIDELLEQLAPLEQVGLPTIPVFPAGVSVAPPTLRRWSPATLPVGLFLRKVNWINDDNYDPPRPDWLEQETPSTSISAPMAKELMPLSPGATPVRQFLQLVNWENREQAATLPTFEAPAEPKAAANGIIVEAFFSNFGFE
ncbi:MAG: hypothetical protein SNJ82_09325 [Gemmataceae bacterium]